MFGSDILEVAIGLVFVYLLMSLVATAAREALEGWLKDRGQSLEQGLIELVGHILPRTTPPTAGEAAEAERIRVACAAVQQAARLAAGLPAQAGVPAPVQMQAAGPAGADTDQTLLERLYKHPLIFSLFRGDYHPPEDRTVWFSAARKTEGKLPSYIPSANFADALLDVAQGYLHSGAGGAPLSFDRLTAAAWAVPNPPVRRILLLGLSASKGDLDKLRKYLQDWYDGAMDRVSGWYRRKTQVIVFCVGLVLCTALNVNTVVIGHALHENSAMRSFVDAAAAKWVTDGKAGFSAAPKDASPAAGQTATGPAFQAPYEQLEALGLPVGWGGQVRAFMNSRLYPQQSFSGVGALELCIGWLITAFAIMLGAPFWFDVLNMFMVVRSTVKPTEKSPVELSKDTQPSKDPAAKPAAEAANAGGNAAAAAAQPAALSAEDAGAREIAELDPAQRLREEDTLDMAVPA